MLPPLALWAISFKPTTQQKQRADLQQMVYRKLIWMVYPPSTTVPLCLHYLTFAYKVAENEKKERNILKATEFQKAAPRPRHPSTTLTQAVRNEKRMT